MTGVKHYDKSVFDEVINGNKEDGLNKIKSITRSNYSNCQKKPYSSLTKYIFSLTVTKDMEI